ncbi:MAG TPA: hypothetical protein VF755_01200 [Catenuloplanes sp.]|jgi:hypothetical protein
MRADRLRRWCTRLAVLSALGAVPFGVTSAVVGAVGSSADPGVYQVRPWQDPMLNPADRAGTPTPPPPTDPTVGDDVDVEWQ